MLEAILQGKLTREQENLEDVLSAIAFGGFRRASDPAAVVAYLAKARPVFGINPLADAAHKYRASYDDYSFWPQWSAFDNVEFSEPDVLVRLSADGAPDVLALIEAKLWSGKSAYPSIHTQVTDQLAKEWAHLWQRAADSKAVPLLVYLTADYAAPEGSIKEAVDELQQKRPNDCQPAPNIAWLSWRLLSDPSAELHVSADLPVWRDMQAIATRLGLMYFQGFGHREWLPASTYHYLGGDKTYNWQFEKSSVNFNWRWNNS
jgi:hypothetical protein